MIINNNNYSISEIISMLDRKELVVNRTYQRGSGIWPAGPSSYFIDTILEKFPFPKIYMYEYLDKDKRNMRKELVDGQQRIGTIQRFINNEFALSGDTRHNGNRFDDLDEETQDEFLSYTVSVDVIRNASPSEILQMFRRMNAYTMPLNEAEKRHSRFQGEFKWFINQLADDLNEFFVTYGVFNSRQIIRMSDANLIADIILAMERGLISTSPKDLNKLYDDYDESFEHAEKYHDQISQAFDFIAMNFSDLRKTHMMKPYALHSLVTALIHSRYGIQSITNGLGSGSIGSFTANIGEAEQMLLAMAQAHEAKEIDGPFEKYVWGGDRSTDRKPRRTARVSAILKALGVEIPDQDNDAYIA